MRDRDATDHFIARLAERQGGVVEHGQLVALGLSPLPGDEVTTLDGLPITTPARTLLDLAAAGLRDRALEAALDEAERRRLVDFAELDALLARYPRRPGARPLKAQLARYRGPADTRSKLERLVNERRADAGGLPSAPIHVGAGHGATALRGSRTPHRSVAS